MQSSSGKIKRRSSEATGWKTIAVADLSSTMLENSGTLEW
jgi:hypothetical protein